MQGHQNINLPLDVAQGLLSLNVSWNILREAAQNIISDHSHAILT